MHIIKSFTPSSVSTDIFLFVLSKNILKIFSLEGYNIFTFIIIIYIFEGTHIIIYHSISSDVEQLFIMNINSLCIYLTALNCFVYNRRKLPFLYYYNNSHIKYLVCICQMSDGCIVHS